MGCVCVFVYLPLIFNMLYYIMKILWRTIWKRCLKGNKRQLDAAKRDVFSLCYSVLSTEFVIMNQHEVSDHLHIYHLYIYIYFYLYSV